MKVRRSKNQCNNRTMKQWNIINDNTSGSVEILNNTILELERIFKTGIVPDLETLDNQLNFLLEKYPHFLVLYHFVDQFKSQVKKTNTKEISIEESVRNLSGFLEAYKEKWNNCGEALAKTVLKDLDLNDKTILLHSNSYSILILFEALKEKGIAVKLFQTSSAPVNEGKLQAEKLAKLGYEVSFIAEAAIGKFMQDIDYIFLGADAIFKERFLNKTGSLPIALTAIYFNKPIYVVSDSRKYISDTTKYPKLIRIFSDENIKPVEELWKHPPENINVLNFYFEFVPNTLVEKFFFEKDGLSITL